MAEHIIYCPWPLGRNAGGPSGYLWHLREGLRAADAEAGIRFVAPESGRSKSTGLKGALRDAIERARWLGPAWRLIKTYGPTQLGAEVRQILSLSVDGWAMEGEDAWLADPAVTSIHCHTTFDTLKVHNRLKALERRSAVTLYLTSHCPEIPANEKTDILAHNGLQVAKTEAVHAKLLAIDAAAFQAADVVVFPCEEAMEPYFATAASFGDMIRGKELRYVLTGIVPPNRSEPRELDHHGGGLKLSFVGRHNIIKGYDLLTRALPSFLDTSKATLFVAGSEGPLPTPSHPRWREMGWTNNPGSLISATDAFVLANKQTYFDLVALEVLSLGVPIIASNTGGNKALARQSPGVMLFEPTEAGLVAALQAFQAMPPQVRAALGQRNLDTFASEFNEKRFASRYLEMLGAGGRRP